jgi:hypothetical protein
VDQSSKKWAGAECARLNNQRLRRLTINKELRKNTLFRTPYHIVVIYFPCHRAHFQLGVDYLRCRSFIFFSDYRSRAKNVEIIQASKWAEEFAIHNADAARITTFILVERIFSFCFVNSNKLNV